MDICKQGELIDKNKFIDDIYDFNLHDYGCTTYTELTEVTLPAGTYYVIFSYNDDSTDTPELALLS